MMTGYFWMAIGQVKLWFYVFPKVAYGLIVKFQHNTHLITQCRLVKGISFFSYT